MSAESSTIATLKNVVYISNVTMSLAVFLISI